MLSHKFGLARFSRYEDLLHLSRVRSEDPELVREIFDKFIVFIKKCPIYRRRVKPLKL